MQIYIQDRSESTVATIGDFYEDMHKTLTSTGTGSYEFTVSKSEPGQEFLNVGNYVVLLDEQNKGHQFTITKVDQLHDEKTVYAEDASLQLLSKEARPWAKLAKAQPASYYFNKALEGTGWVIGVNQIANLTRTLEWTGWDTVLTRLLSIATEFDNAELDFHVELDRTNVVRKVVDIYKQVGAYRDDIQLVYGDTANDIQKTESTENFATAIEGIGSLVENTKEGEPEKHYDFSAIGYDDGDFYSPKGDPKLYSRKAHEKWDGKYGYSERHFEYETKDPQELLNRSKTELKKRCEPEVNYEISIADGRLIDINKGDTVKIFDHTYNPELLLQARAVEVDKSYTDPSQNKAIFGNFLTLISNVDPRILAIQQQLRQLPKARTPYPWVRYADDDQGNGISAFPKGKLYMATVWSYETAVPSDNPIDYANKWIKVKGEDGQDGSNGVPGPKGSDGQTSYFHTAWADDISGTTGFTTSGGDGKKYIGTYSDLTKADSEDPSKYNWALFKGEDGKDGRTPIKGTDYFDGKDGQDGKSSYLWIRYSANSDGTDMTSDPTGAKYVGYATTQTNSEPTLASAYKWQLVAGKDGIAGEKGTDGKTSFLHIRYSNDGGKTFTANSGETVGTYIGQYTDFTQSDSNNVSDYKWALIKGDKGDTGDRGLQGLQGDKGDKGIKGPAGADGKSSYTHIAYANIKFLCQERSNFTLSKASIVRFGFDSRWVYKEFKAGTYAAETNLWGQGDPAVGAYKNAELVSEFSTSNYADKTHIGVYVDSTATDSTDPSKYKWTLIKGADGSQGTPGKAGTDGKTPYLHTAYSWSADGTDRFTTVYPRENLYLNSKTIQGRASRLGPAITSKEPFDSTTNMWHFVAAEGSSKATGLYLFNYANEKLPDTTDWTYSADIKGTGKVIKFGIEAGNANPVVGTIGTEWSRISQTGRFDKPTSKTIVMYFDTTDSPLDVYIKLPKLEIGKTPTPWTPSPLDDPEGAYPKFIGTYTDYIADDSTDPSKYTWAKLRGEQGQKGDSGADGKPGKDGVGIKSTLIQYASNTSGTVAPTSGWATTIPAALPGHYVWTKYTWTYTDGTTEAGYSVGKIGETGQTGQKGDTGPRGSTGATGAKGTTGPIGPQGPKGDPGSKDVPVTTVSAAQPATAKDGDIWWVLNSKDVATAMKVYTSGAWVDKKVDQSVLNIVTLNAVEINGSTINGSEFNTSYTGTLVDGQQGSSQQTLDNTGYSQTSTFSWLGGPIVTRSEINNTGGIMMGYSNQSEYNPSQPWANNIGSINIDPINLYIGFTATGLSGDYYLNVQDAYQNSGSATYLNGWGSWNADYSLKVVRQGRMVTVWGYIKHNNSATITPFAQVPAWARPQQGILISAVTFNSKVDNPIASALVMNAETGRIGFNSGGQKGGYVCFSTTYVGGLI